MSASYLTNGSITAYFDAVIERTRSYDAEVPEYVTERGYYVSETVQRHAQKISLSVFVSNNPMSNADDYVGKTSGDRLGDTCNFLVQLFNSGEKLTLYSNGKKYKNVVIKGLTLPKTSDMRDSMEIQIELVQVRTVTAKVATVAEEIKRVNSIETSQASLFESLFENGSEGSIAYNLAKWLKEEKDIDIGGAFSGSNS